MKRVRKIAFALLAVVLLFSIVAVPAGAVDSISEEEPIALPGGPSEDRVGVPSPSSGRTYVPFNHQSMNHRDAIICEGGSRSHGYWQWADLPYWRAWARNDSWDFGVVVTVTRHTPVTGARANQFTLSPRQQGDSQVRVASVNGNVERRYVNFFAMMLSTPQGVFSVRMADQLHFF